MSFDVSQDNCITFGNEVRDSIFKFIFELAFKMI